MRTLWLPRERRGMCLHEFIFQKSALERLKPVYSGEPFTALYRSVAVLELYESALYYVFFLSTQATIFIWRKVLEHRETEKQIERFGVGGSLCGRTEETSALYNDRCECSHNEKLVAALEQPTMSGFSNAWGDCWHTL